jgi:hypothetical protein
MVEKPLDEYLDENCTEKTGFYHFKSAMISHSTATNTFYNNFLEGLEKGLKNVN